MDPIVEKVLIAGCSILATGLLTMILGKAGLFDRIFSKRKLKKAEAKQKEREERKADVLESVGELLKPIREDIQELKVKSDAAIRSNVVNTRCNMKHDLDEYEKRGYATSNEKSAWREMLNVYRDNGGNHFAEYVNGWEKKLESLPEAPVKKRKNAIAKKQKEIK